MALEEGLGLSFLPKNGEEGVDLWLWSLIGTTAAPPGETVAMTAGQEVADLRGEVEENQFHFEFASDSDHHSS